MTNFVVIPYTKHGSPELLSGTTGTFWGLFVADCWMIAWVGDLCGHTRLRGSRHRINHFRWAVTAVLQDCFDHD